MTEPLDELTVQSIGEYGGKPLTDLGKENVEFSGDEEEKAKKEEQSTDTQGENPVSAGSAAYMSVQTADLVVGRVLRARRQPPPPNPARQAPNFPKSEDPALVFCFVQWSCWSPWLSLFYVGVGDLHSRSRSPQLIRQPQNLVLLGMRVSTLGVAMQTRGFHRHAQQVKKLFFVATHM